jgi:hypothetical protein
MTKNYDTEREIRELEAGISSIKNYGKHFISYNVKYLGHSFSDEYKIGGKSIKGSKTLNEFCYGYDEVHGQLHLLHVYQMLNGVKYAAIEISNNVYAFWEIIN